MQRGTWLALVFACVTALAKKEEHHKAWSSSRGLKLDALSKHRVAKPAGTEMDLSATATKLEVQRLSNPRKNAHQRWFMSLAGVSIGVLLYGAFMYFSGWGKLSSLDAESSLVQASMSEGLEVQGLVQVRPVLFGGAFFKQFSWCPEADKGRSLRIHDVQGKQVAIATGALIRTSEAEEVSDGDEYDCGGELSLLVGTTVWAVLHLNEEVGTNLQMSWPSFKVLTAQGTTYAEVKLLSDAKCIVEGPPPLRRLLMTVVGNFCHNEFFCGDRNIHVWIAQAGTERTRVGAQCETRIETLRTTSGSRRARSYFVSTTGHADTPLVMAVMLGLQEIHTMIVLRQRQSGVADTVVDLGAEDVDEQGEMTKSVNT
jgi:hypothetical protein